MIVDELANEFEEVKNNPELKREIEKLVYIDEKTGLLNGRYLDIRLKREFEEAKRYNHPLSFIIADIDSFKEYNDKYGHREGDKVLKKIADKISPKIRDSDSIFRTQYKGRMAFRMHGERGDEFCLILPETDLEGAIELAKRLKKNIVKHKGEEITLSFGIGTYSEKYKDKIENEKDLVEMTDKALFLSKKEGKNRVKFFLEI